MTTTSEAMDAALLAAHEAGDASALIGFYTQAADAAQSADQQGFFLTQAYVFALEANDATAGPLHERLIAAGREQPLAAPRSPKR